MSALGISYSGENSWKRRLWHSLVEFHRHSKYHIQVASVLPGLPRLEIETAVYARTGIWSVSRACSGPSFGRYDKDRVCSYSDHGPEPLLSLFVGQCLCGLAISAKNFRDLQSIVYKLVRCVIIIFKHRVTAMKTFLETLHRRPTENHLRWFLSVLRLKQGSDDRGPFCCFLCLSFGTTVAA